MLEDLCVAVEWLSTVTFRVVERAKKEKSADRESEGGFDVKNPKGYGYADGVWIRRSRTSEAESDNGGESFSSRDTGTTQSDNITGIKWGQLVVDVEVNFTTAQTIREAKRVMGRGQGSVVGAMPATTTSVREGGRRWKKLTRRASSPLLSSGEKLAAQQNALGVEGGEEKLRGLEMIFERAGLGGGKKESPSKEEDTGSCGNSPSKPGEWGEIDMNGECQQATKNGYVIVSQSGDYLAVFSDEERSNESTNESLNVDAVPLTTHHFALRSPRDCRRVCCPLHPGHQRPTDSGEQQNRRRLERPD